MSKPAEAKLEDIQAWLHTFVVEPGNQDRALQAAEQKAGFSEGSAESLILPSPTLQPRERIQIYRGMYLLRMQEALEMDFPAILDRLGSTDFKQLVAAYVESHPSSSYTLDHLGRHFAQYLEETNHAGEGHFLSDLARLEWSICEVAIAHDSEVLKMTDLAEIAPDDFLSIRLRLVPALQTHEFSHNTNEVFKAWGNEETIPEVEKRDTRLVVWRHDLQVWRMNLSQAALAFLDQLREGRMLGEALDLVIEEHQTTEEQLFEWFQEWVGEGFFAALNSEN